MRPVSLCFARRGRKSLWCLTMLSDVFICLCGLYAHKVLSVFNCFKQMLCYKICSLNSFIAISLNPNPFWFIVAHLSVSQEPIVFISEPWGSWSWGPICFLHRLDKFLHLLIVPLKHGVPYRPSWSSGTISKCGKSLSVCRKLVGPPRRDPFSLKHVPP